MEKNKNIYFWFQEFKELANQRCLSHLIGDMESHRESFDDGESPMDELEHQIDAANASM